MKQSIVLIALLLGFQMGFGQKFIINDANAQKRNPGVFSGVEVSDAIDLYVSQGEEQGVAVSAFDPDARERIRTVVEGGVLKIWFDGKGWSDWSGGKHLKAYVSAKTINLIKASGACDVKIMGAIQAQKLAIDLKGASDLSGDISCQELAINISGASDMKLNGKAGKISGRLTGASSIKGWGLVGEFCDIEAGGASSVNVTVNKELKVKASGASDINYKGEAIIREMKSNGASSINKKDG